MIAQIFMPQLDASCHVQKTQSLDTGRFLQITVSKDLRDPLPDSSWLHGGHLTGRRCYSTVSPQLPLSCPLPHFLLYKEALASSVQIGQEGGKPSCPATNHRTLCGGHLVHQAKWSQRQPHSTETWQLSGGKSGHREVYSIVICRYSKVSPSGLCAAEQYLSMQIGSDCSGSVETISKCSLWALGCGLMVSGTVILCLFFLSSECVRER